MSTDDDYDFDDLAEFDDPEPEEEEDDLSDLVDDEDEDEDDEVPLVSSASSAKGTPARSTGQTPEPPEVLFSRAEKPRPGLISVPATKTSEAIRRPLMSGHCSAPQSKNPEESHKRCRGYSRANPDKTFQPCPDLCHFPEERYECAGCGGTIIEAPHYPLDEDGDVRYVHLDTKRNRVADGECPR